MPAPVPDRIVFATESITIGAFRCPPSHPLFRDSGPIRNDCFVFPRTTVEIRHRDARPFLADPTIVTLYNRQQYYERRSVGGDGDRCDWYAVTPDVLRGALLRHDPSAADATRPIRFTHTLADPDTYFAQRRLFVEARRAGADPLDPLRIEEGVVRLLDRVLAGAYGGTRRRESDPARRWSGAIDLAHAAKAWMAPRIATRLTLARIAGALDCSIFHLCRSFRRATGMTLHAYREQVRVRVALERLEGSEPALTRLALDLGYSSHSHFTSGFKRAFGATPSQARRRLTGRRASF